MKAKKIIFIFMISTALLESCRKDEQPPSATPLGTITVDLNANNYAVRKKEALIGNLICDAVKKDIENKGKTVDFVFVNAGSIRFSAANRPSGIYKAGVFTSEMIDEMMPFGDATVIVKLTGAQLKEVLERSVSQYPLAKGLFLQMSKEINISIDTLQPAQIINIDGTAIVSPGSRIQSIKIKSVNYDPAAMYAAAFPDFIAEGNDGYVTLKNIAASMKDNLVENQSNGVKEYIIVNTPVTPVIEGRILFQ